MEQLFERRRWLLPLVLAIATIIFLRPVVFPTEPGAALDGNDFRAMFYPLHQYIFQTVHSGELPLWNPHQFIGHPTIGNPHSALFYPATWFMWLVGVKRGMDLSLVFHVWLGAWGMALLARSFKASYLASLLAGIIYGMSGWTGARLYVGHYNLFVVYGLASWMLVAYRYALARGTWRSTLFGIVVTGAALLAGYPPLVLYAGLGLVSLWVFHVAQVYARPANPESPDGEQTGDLRIRELWQAAWYAGRLLAIIVVGGIVLGAALVIPALQLSSLSIRSTTDLTFANSYALPPFQLLDLAMPFLFGNPRGNPFYWGGEFFEEFTAYVGLLPLLAIPLALRWKKIENWYFLALIAFGLVLSIGVDGALMPLFVWWVPGYSSFRVPARGLMFVVIGAAGLTALLVTALQRSTPAERRKLLKPAIRVWIPVSIVLLITATIAISIMYTFSFTNGDQPRRLYGSGDATAVAAMILLGVELVLWLWTDRDPRTARFAMLATILLVTLDAWHVAILIIKVDQVQEPPLWQGARVNIPLGPDSRVLAPTHFDDIASETGHLDVSGYDPLPIEAYDKLRSVGDSTDPTAAVNTLLGVKYLMVEQPYNKPNFQLIGIAPGGIYYKRTDAFPRAWFASSITVEPNDDAVRAGIGKATDLTSAYVDHALTPDCPTSSSGTASITDYRPNDIAIQTHGSGGLMVLTDQYYPGWQAAIDGQAAEIYRTDTVFRGVCVPAGDHVVTFAFRPAALYVGMVISAIGWLAVLILAIIGYRKYRQVSGQVI